MIVNINKPQDMDDWLKFYEFNDPTFCAALHYGRQYFEDPNESYKFACLALLKEKTSRLTEQWLKELNSQTH